MHHLLSTTLKTFLGDVFFMKKCYHVCDAPFAVKTGFWDVWFTRSVVRVLRQYVVHELASRLRPELEAAVKRNEAPAGASYVPGDSEQVYFL